jgi:hypothetical protein
MSYSLEIDQKQLEKLTKVPEEIGKRSFKYLVQEIHAGFIDESPVDKGRLQKWKRKKVNDWEYSIYDGPEYALYVALGTGVYGEKGTPYTIYPKTKQCLHFVWNGHEVFAKHVTVQGQQPNPYHERGVQRGVNRIDEFIRKAQKEVEGGS